MDESEPSIADQTAYNRWPASPMVTACLLLPPSTVPTNPRPRRRRRRSPSSACPSRPPSSA
ncbi:hypothetical protein ABZP36_034675 [Zizania latifolia]